MSLSSMNAPAMDILKKAFICIISCLPIFAIAALTSLSLTISSTCILNVAIYNMLSNCLMQCLKGMLFLGQHLFQGMDVLFECRPNEYAFTSVLISCDYLYGKQMHALALMMGCDASIYVANALITMYSKSYKIEEA
ncbi:hypothetical protein CRYUN_Cryun03dG0113900 [Craigia yunnanensis]